MGANVGSDGFCHHCPMRLAAATTRAEGMAVWISNTSRGQLVLEKGTGKHKWTTFVQVPHRSSIGNVVSPPTGVAPVAPLDQY
jgi:hypothetical protein